MIIYLNDWSIFKFFEDMQSLQKESKFFCRTCNKFDERTFLWMRQVSLSDKKNRLWVESRVYTRSKINCLNDKSIRQFENFEQDKIITSFFLNRNKNKQRQKLYSNSTSSSSQFSFRFQSSSQQQQQQQWQQQQQQQKSQQFSRNLQSQFNFARHFRTSQHSMFEISNETKDMQFAIKMKMTLKKFSFASIVICLNHLQLTFGQFSVFRFSASALIFFCAFVFFFDLRVNLSFVLRIRLSFDFRFCLYFGLQICLFLDLRIRLFFDFRISILFDLGSFLILLMDSFFDFRIFRLFLFFRSLNSLSSFFFRSLRMSFFYSASIMFHVAISRISNKKRRVKFLNMSENVSFFRDAKMFDDDVKMKNAKKKYQFLQYKNYESIRN